MDIKKVWEKTKNFFKKIEKKNFIIAGSVLAVGVAVTLAWVLTDGASNGGFDYSQSSGMISQNVEASKTDGEENTLSDYFAVSQANRTRAREEAMAVLSSVVESETADQTAKDKAAEEIAQIARDIESESNIESLVVSKGFDACVAVISGGTASIVVDSDSLVDSQLSQINEIVYEYTGILPENIKIIHK